MNISGLNTAYSEYVSPSIGGNGDTAAFNLAMTQQQDEPKKTKREITEKEIKDFFAKMGTYGNALTYVVKSNLEKIKEMIEAKKEELKKANGFYSEPPLSPEQKLVEYKKELKQKSMSLKDILTS